MKPFLYRKFAALTLWCNSNQQAMWEKGKWIKNINYSMLCDAELAIMARKKSNKDFD